jgi:hypothetical protein
MFGDRSSPEVKPIVLFSAQRLRGQALAHPTLQVLTKQLRDLTLDRDAIGLGAFA